MRHITKNISIVLVFGLLTVGCYPDDMLIPIEPELAANLKIKEDFGIKLESVFVTEEASMNVKAPYAGKFSVIIHHISGRTVSKEEVLLEEGDNILKVYTGALPKQPYTVAFYNNSGNKLGESIINVY